MSRETIQNKLNASMELISYNKKSAVFQLEQKNKRKYTMRIPVSFASPQDKSLLEEIVDSIERKKGVRFKGDYIEKPTSYFAYIMAGLNLLLLINPRSTLEVFKRYRYEGEIFMGKKKKAHYQMHYTYHNPLNQGFEISKK